MADRRISVCMVATTTVAAAGVAAGILIVAFAFLLYAYGKYRHSQQSGVVDMHDYEDTRLQLISANATEEALDPTKGGDGGH